MSNQLAQEKKLDPSLETGGAQAGGSTVNGSTGESGSEQKVQKTEDEVKYDRYLGMVNAMGYSLDEAENNVNVVGIRGWLDGDVVENIKDKYNDTIVCLYHEKDAATGQYVKKCAEFVASVEPGKYSQDYSGGKGDAHLMDGQYNYYKGSHKGYEAYNTSSSTVWRDKNRDGIRQEGEYEETGSYGINIHAAGNQDQKVGNWSAGCQVIASKDSSSGSSNKEFARFRNIINTYDADKKFVYTLITGSLAKERAAQGYTTANTNTGATGPVTIASTAAEINVTSAVSKNKELGFSQSQWKEIQKALGFTGGDVDGLVGKNTTKRIAKYQESNGLPITGICDTDTYNHIMGLASGQASEETTAGETAAETTTTEAAAEAAQEQPQTATVTAADIDVSSAVSDNKSLGYSKAQWKEIQKGLGFKGGDVDGIVGKNTTKAIAKYQEMNGIPVTGVCDKNTHDHILGLNAPQMASGSENAASASETVETAAAVTETSAGGEAASNSTAGQAATVDIDKALKANKNLGYSKALWKEIQSGIGLTGKDVDGIVGKITTRKIAEWQESNGIEPTGICDSNTLGRIRAAQNPTTETTTTQAPPQQEQGGGSGSESTPESGSTPTVQVLTEKQLQAARKWYSGKDFTEDDIKKIQSVVGVNATGSMDDATIQAIAAWQKSNNLTVDGEFGSGSATRAGLALTGLGNVYHENVVPVDNSEIPLQKTVRANKSIYGHIDDVPNQLVTVTPAYPVYSGSGTSKNLATIKVHKKVADRVSNIFNQVKAAYTPEEITELGLDRYSGCYSRRKTTGSNTMSIHSWGVAIDIDAKRNPYKSNGKEPLASNKAKKFWEIVESNGGQSLGRNFGYDWMHFAFIRYK